MKTTSMHRNYLVILRSISTLAILSPLFLIHGKAANAQSYTLTTLAAFNGSGNGQNPQGSVTFGSNGNLYGTTKSGGAFGDGTAFEIAAGTNLLTTLATFNGTNGTGPSGGLILDSQGNFYGKTETGGASGDGTVYEIAAGTNAITTLGTFNGSNGRLPSGELTRDSSGNLYGTAGGGGANDDGTVFEIAAGTQTITTLATFNYTNGSDVSSNLTTDSSGNLYGTTIYGGAYGDGIVFKISAGSHALTTLYSFGNGSLFPDAGLALDSSGNIYGTTTYGDFHGYGCVFELVAGSNSYSYTSLAAFNGAGNGKTPSGGLIFDSNGNLYGTTFQGGANGDGTVFKIAAGNHSLSTILTFSSANGSLPNGTLTIDNSGNIYGTTENGGANNDGTVFKLTPSGSAAAPEPDSLLLLILTGLPVVFLRVTQTRFRTL